MIRLKGYLIAMGLWLAQRGGWMPCALTHLPDDAVIRQTKAITQDVQRRFPEAPGEFKRREALRVLLNVAPLSATRDLNLLIELALQTPDLLSSTDR